MLNELRIENFAIIDQLEIQFNSGLVIFTGETGAGKSIIIDALETIMGNRADSTSIRSGADRANVEATFQISETIREPIHALLVDGDLLDDDEYVTLGRELRRNGRNVARINGRSVSVSLLHQIGEYLVDIHGQSQHLSLLRVRQHLSLLDRYAESGLLLRPYQKTYQQYHDVRRELETLRQNERDAARRADLLSYQIDEIDSAHLKLGEDDDLQEERSRLANAEGLASLSQETLHLLDEGDPENPAITDLLGEVVNALNNLARIDTTQAQISAQATSLFEDITELSRNIRDYLEGIEFNPKRLIQVEERIDLIQNLKRKYGNTLEAVLSFSEKASRELDDITHTEERITELEVGQDKLLSTLAEQGLALSEKRKITADQLAKSIETELDDLRMEGARFKVDFEKQPHPQGVALPNGDRVAFDATGLERVEFLVETNPGEGFQTPGENCFGR